MSGSGPASPSTISLLAQVEREIQGDPERLALLARLYAHPRLAQATPIFGPLGQKTLALWRRAAAVSRGRQPESLLEVELEAVKQTLAGSRAQPSKKSLETMMQRVESVLGEDSSNPRALYFKAHIYEMLGDDDRALLTWTRLLWVFNKGKQKEAFSWILDEAMGARDRIDRKMIERRLRRGLVPR